MEIVFSQAVFWIVFGFAVAGGIPTKGWLCLLGAWVVGTLVGAILISDDFR